MAAVLLSVHVLAAIVLIGPVTAAASLFPRYARAASTERPARGAAEGVARALHRISSGYAVVAVAVPAFGIGTAAQLGVLDEAWLWAATALTAAAGVLLALVVVPGQRRVLAALEAAAAPADRAPVGGPLVGEAGTRGAVDGAVTGTPAVVEADLRRLSAATGAFALTWAVVVVLMVARPGSTTGV